jgi:hypothetical protein
MRKNIAHLLRLTALALTYLFTNPALAVASQSRLIVTVNVVNTCHIPNMQWVIMGPKTVSCLPTARTGYLEFPKLPLFNVSVDEKKEQVTYTF